MHITLKRLGVAVAGALLATAAVSAPAHAEPAALSGTITSATTAQPVPGCASVYDTSWSWVGGTCTDDTGAWSVDGLVAGNEYRVQISPSDDVHVGEWAQDADSFEAAKDYVAPATVDVALSPGAVLAGTISMADGDPVPPGTWVSIHDSDGDQVGYATADGGDWRAVVPAGQYRVAFYAPPLEQWAFGKSSMAEADPVSAVAGETTRVDDTLPGIEETTFDGTITASDTGEPLDGCVYAYETETGENRGSTCTGQDGSGIPGHWTLDGLQAGTPFTFQFMSWDGVHASEWAVDSASMQHATTYVGPATVDVALERGATMSGLLTMPTGEPAPANITIQSVDDEFAQVYAWTSYDGSWSELLRPGRYVVEFNDGINRQWAIGSADREGARVYTLAGGDTVSVVDELRGSRTVYGVVTGTVTSDVDGSPIEGACVSVEPWPVDLDSPTSYGEGCTDESGHYSVEVTGEGAFTAAIRDPSGQYAGEYHGDTQFASQSASFTFPADSSVVVDAGLALGGTITGLAVDAKLGTPIADLCPSPYSGESGHYARFTTVECTGADGRWTVRGLAAGSYTVLISGGATSDHVPTWAFKSESQASADLISVAAGRTTSVRAVRLAPGGVLSGVITDPFGQPVVGAFVDASGKFPGRAGPGEGQHVAQTDSSGRYTIKGLPAGDYRPIVYAGDYDAFAPEWSGDADSAVAASPVTVKPAKTSTFNAQVAAGARITGQVVRTDGSEPPAFLDGDVVDAQGRTIGSLVWDGASLRSSALPAGDFSLVLHYDDRIHYWYDGVRFPEDATTVHVGRGEQKAVTFHIPPLLPSEQG